MIPSNHWLRVKPIAHKGMYNNSIGIIENSREAFRKASLFDYPIELDVRITRYCTVIIYHDKNIKRLTGVDKDCYDLTNDDLINIKFKNSHSHIATLKEILELINGKVPLLIELKYQGSYRKTKNLAKACNKLLSEYKGEYAIQSFHPFLYKIYRKYNSNIFIGLIGPIKIFNHKILFKWLLKHYDFLSYNIKCLPDSDIANIDIPKLYWHITDKKKETMALDNNGNLLWSDEQNIGYHPPKKI